jgi:hypothetical protein
MNANNHPDITPRCDGGNIYVYTLSFSSNAETSASGSPTTLK